MATTLSATVSRPRRILRGLVRVLILLVVMHATFSAGAYWAMRQPPDVFGQIMAKIPFPIMMALPFETLWNSARGGKVQVGDMAPDFTLPTLDHKSTVHLADFRGSRPVVLVFGSYT